MLGTGQIDYYSLAILLSGGIVATLVRPLERVVHGRYPLVEGIIPKHRCRWSNGAGIRFLTAAV